MSNTVLKDSRGNRIGNIREQANGKRVAYDARGFRVGEHTPRDNTTRDARGNRVGSGDFLASLLTSPH